MQANTQAKTGLLDIASETARPEGAVSQAEIGRRLERAAALVEDFAETAALPALDACLAAAAGAEAAKAPPLGPLAEELCQQTAMLQDEVERFLSHIDGCRKA